MGSKMKKYDILLTIRHKQSGFFEELCIETRAANALAAIKKVSRDLKEKIDETGLTLEEGISITLKEKMNDQPD